MRSMTIAIRLSVHRSVGNPWARGPFSSARSRLRRSASERRGRRPARPAPARPLAPPSAHALYQRLTLGRETPSARTTSAWVLPRSNIRPARIRRRSISLKSLGAPRRAPLVALLFEARAEGLAVLAFLTRVTTVRSSHTKHSDVTLFDELFLYYAK